MDLWDRLSVCLPTYPSPEAPSETACTLALGPLSTSGDSRPASNARPIQRLAAVQKAWRQAERQKRWSLPPEDRG